MSAFPFLSLPFEIRTMVYAEYSTQIRMQFMCSSRPYWEIPGLEGRGRFQAYEVATNLCKLRASSLLYASGQLRAEFLQYLAENKTLLIQSWLSLALVNSWKHVGSDVPSLVRNNLRTISIRSRSIVPGNVGYAYLTGVVLDDIVTTMPQLIHIELYGESNSVTLNELLRPNKTCDTEGAAEESMRLAAPRFADHYETFFRHVRRKGLAACVEFEISYCHDLECCYDRKKFDIKPGLTETDGPIIHLTKISTCLDRDYNVSCKQQHLHGPCNKRCSMGRFD